MKISYDRQKFLQELSQTFSNRGKVINELIKLNESLNLPKGTEHFMSDLHGEWEAFSHIRKSASGVIRNKLKLLFSNEMSPELLADFSTLIYYPEEKLSEIKGDNSEVCHWYALTLSRLGALLKLLSEKYTKDFVEEKIKKLGLGYEYIICALMYEKPENYRKILKNALRLGIERELIISMSAIAKSLVIDHLHIVGDIYDRGPRPDLIMDELSKEASLDIEWGNHDVLWMGAGAGSEACIATVLNNAFTYKNLDTIEIGYGISLRPLSTFAEEVYKDSDVSAFLPKGEFGGDLFGKNDDLLIARMHKAISVIQFKCEGNIIKRHPEYHMDDRMLLHKIDKTRRTVKIDDKEYELKDGDFPTLTEDAYALTDYESRVMEYLKNAFANSEKLRRHIKLLYSKGSMYKIYNQNLLFHGCIPMTKSGELMKLDAVYGLCGKELMDKSYEIAFDGYFEKNAERRQFGKDFLWFLWCGKNSPLSAREQITTFERLLVKNDSLYKEPKNAYYKVWSDKKLAEKILMEFGLCTENSHIINGHIPITSGESPIKAEGKVIVIDGGFCRAYHSTTGIAGYTLIFNAEGLKLSAHEPFLGIERAIKTNADIISEEVVFQRTKNKIKVRETDKGIAIRERMLDLLDLLKCYEKGIIKETG